MRAHLFARSLAFLLATAVTAALGTVASTQSVLLRLGELGVALPLAVRAEATLHDLLFMGPVYAALVAAGFLLALPVAAWLGRRFGARAMFFALAGAAALATILLAMKGVLGITTIAGARSAPGFAAQVTCGGLGGWLFARLTAASAARRGASV